jgi:hypothetical protein
VCKEKEHKEKSVNMDYLKKIEEYKRKFRNVHILKFIDFLETLVEWVDLLKIKKRISWSQEKLVQEAMPTHIFQVLDLLQEEKFTMDTFNTLKKVLFTETKELLGVIMHSTSIKVHDFDLLQFNLYQIFGKEELASLIEWSRLDLEKAVKERIVRAEQKKKRELAKKEAHLRKIRSMSEEDLRKFVIKNLFDFTPSARTFQERKKAITSHQRIIVGHRETFHGFEEKLSDATVKARREAQTNVYTRLGDVKRHMDVVASRFQKKAKQFISEEGPRKMIRGARKTILEQKEVLQEEMKDKGKTWEKVFGSKIEASQQKIIVQKGHLNQEIAGKEKKWHTDIGEDIDTARSTIIKGKKDLRYEQAYLLDYIHAHGVEEVKQASVRMVKGKEDFIGDIGVAKQVFSGKAEEIAETGKDIDTAREKFLEKRDVAAGKFTKRGEEVESEMYGSLYKGKIAFEKKRVLAQERFLGRAKEIQESALIKKRKTQKQGVVKQQGPVKPGEKMVKGATRAQGRITAAQQKMSVEADKKKKKMVEDIQRHKELFAYEVRFASHAIKKNAEAFAERVAERREAFEARGEELVARHKARQKAHLIQNLLRTIRGM